jgi:LmbE family N-acetylglucosaminyl deacetylase
MESIGLLADGKAPKRVLALGAHSDDIEIGCGGTILRLAAERPQLEVLWVVFAATKERAAEARASACAFLEGVAATKVVVRDYRDGFLPYSGAAVKDEFEALKKEFSPDLIFTHYRNDRHQDHRLVSDLTWNTWRDHFILEYEIPKYDGDLGKPNAFVPISRPMARRKVNGIYSIFKSQLGQHWFTPDLFFGMMRIRGIECCADFAEAFHSRKAIFDVAGPAVARPPARRSRRRTGR